MKKDNLVEDNEHDDTNVESDEMSKEESSEISNSTGGDRTVSSDEHPHEFENKIIGKTVRNGKDASEYVEPEYTGKRCLVCKGKFNVRSKYHGKPIKRRKFFRC